MECIVFYKEGGLKIRATLLCVLTVLLVGCAQYTKVYISAKDLGTNTEVPFDVYSGKDGLYLGLSPLTLDMQKYENEPNPVMSILLNRHGCYPTYWQIVEISNWANSKENAGNVSFQNKVHFKVKC